MIASHLLLTSMWLVTISSGLTASVEGPNFAIVVNQAECDTSRGLRALAVEEEPQRRPGCMIPFRKKQRKIVRSKKGLTTIKNWDLNQEPVVSLRKSSAQFTKWEAEIQIQLEWLGKDKENFDKTITQTLPQAKESFNTIKEGIKVLKNMRLMLLGEVYNRFPDEIFGLITESLSRNLVQSVKKFITGHNRLFSWLALKYKPKHPKFQYGKDGRYRLYTLTPLDYSFGIIDFLLEYRLISPEEVRDIFQDKKMVEQVVNYTVRQYENDLGFSSWVFMVNLTKHWRWQSMNKFCTALSKKELDRIDLVFLIGRLRCINASPGALYDSAGLRRDDRPFVYEKYFGKSNSLDASNSLVSSGFKQGQIGHQIYPECNPTEKDEIIHQLLPKRYDMKTLIRIVDIFAFMEEELCPGIVSQLLKNRDLSDKLKKLVKLDGSTDKPEDVFHLASIYSRNEMLSHSAEQLIKSVFLDKKTHTKFYVLQDKEIYEDHIFKRMKILNTGKDTHIRLPSVGEFYASEEYEGFSSIYPHCVEGDLNKMIDILDHARRYEEIPIKLKQKEPVVFRAWTLNSAFLRPSSSKE
ncbi:hypothetical protein H4Q26_008486 [Puccinia striiformis f. sp. tritici PST-130]|uniref:Uncharacterized protein n=3 Tax=Puccinia striiformis TaxID=27350 RepID=A0A0L0UPR8_9BASI|nr:hypothetical protein H4Q26_008486 [Puccinia striiformis f. sp. tritici PST-130]KNE89067.1 hypothetical protein PSTG_17474 [Puccinia striiformis f. sp. tritici PST-78]